MDSFKDKAAIEEKILETEFLKEIHISDLENSMNAFSDMMGLSLEFATIDGEVLLSTDKNNLCRNYHRKNTQMSKHCLNTSAHKKLVSGPGESYQIYQCKNNLHYGIIPIEVKGVHTSNIFIRDFYLEERPDPEIFEEHVKVGGFPKEKYLQDFKSIPIITYSKIDQIIRYLRHSIVLVGKMSLAQAVEESLQKELRHANEELQESHQELEDTEKSLRKYVKELEDQEGKLKKSENRIRHLYKKMNQGLALHEMIFDENQQPRDYRFIDVNPRFEKLTGLSRKDLIGKTVLEVLPETESYWLETYGEVIRYGATMEFEHYSRALGRYYEVSAFKVDTNRFATLITDITERKTEEERLLEGWFKTVESLGNMVELRDPYTSGHQRSVANLAKVVAEHMELSKKTVNGIYLAALLHDIGKISIPAEILSKPIKLTEEEFSLIKTHPDKGSEIIKSIDFPWKVKEMIRQHHEKLDGSGYPLGLTEKEILLESQLITVADMVEAMSSHRPYRPSLGLDFAIEEIKRISGTKLREDVVDAFCRLYDQGIIHRGLFEE